MPNSPADVAGLLPYSDYVIGSPEGQMRGDSGLSELIEDVRASHPSKEMKQPPDTRQQFLNRPLRLFVYNNEYDVTRMITITPTRNWGGDGALGCILGYGALHRVPAPLNEPAQAPGETLFETARFSNEEARSNMPTPTPTQPGDFLVPANMNLSATTPPPPPTGGEKRPARKQRVHHAISPTAGLDDYFAEGEQKSRELDNAPTPKQDASLPPPPKAGGPPRAAAKSPVGDVAPQDADADAAEAVEA